MNIGIQVMKIMQRNARIYHQHREVTDYKVTGPLGMNKILECPSVPPFGRFSFNSCPTNARGRESSPPRHLFLEQGIPLEDFYSGDNSNILDFPSGSISVIKRLNLPKEDQSICS